MIGCVGHKQGFTVVEVMAVLAIVSVLLSVAMILHHHALAKAQAVEGEVILDEIRRLETVYYANHGVYSPDLNAIGFTLTGSRLYHKVDLQLHDGGTAYQAMAVPLRGAGKQLALRLTQRRDGQVTWEKIDPTALSSFAESHPPTDQGAGGSNTETGGTSAKANCRQGGEATVAQDGLLDMNFCLR